MDVTPETAPEAEKYLKRTYKGQLLQKKLDNLTMFGKLDEKDFKFVKAVMRMKKSHNQIQSGKGKMIFLEDLPQIGLPQPPPDKKETKTTKTTKETKAVKAVREKINHICKAIKMSGERCKFKAQCDSEFCGKHGKK